MTAHRRKNGEEAAKKRGADGFDAYYGAIFGNRWSALKEALAKPVKYTQWSENLVKPYALNAASAAAALALPPIARGETGAALLDMCAAPGGKTLVLSRLLRENPDLIIAANERSSARRERLSRVINEYLSPQTRERIVVTNYDAAALCRGQKNAYDRILLDAPCSSERHVFSSAAHLSRWSSARVKNLAYAQWALISSAFLMLKPNGYLLYSTCALTPCENEEIISKLIKKYPQAAAREVRIASQIEALGVSSERAELGAYIMPDVSDGAGPIYYCLIEKTVPGE